MPATAITARGWCVERFRDFVCLSVAHQEESCAMRSAVMSEQPVSYVPWKKVDRGARRNKNWVAARRSFNTSAYGTICRRKAFSTFEDLCKRVGELLPLLLVICALSVTFLSLCGSILVVVRGLLLELNLIRQQQIGINEGGFEASVEANGHPRSEGFPSLSPFVRRGIQSFWTLSVTKGAPVRRLQNVISVGPPDGYTGFDAQNMWNAFKSAPQDYLLVGWFVLNLLLAGCFCSWMCSQRNYQKAVMVSP